MGLPFDEKTNPVGLNGVDFVEYSGSDANYFIELFKKYGFKSVAQIPEKNIQLFRQERINFIVNCQAGTFAADFAKKHGPSICSTGFRVFDADHAFRTAVKRGARPFDGDNQIKGATPFPAVYGIGDSLIYFVDENLSGKLYNDIFQVRPENKNHKGVGFVEVDHFTNNVPVGEMQKWCDFYHKIFNFRETRYFDIKGLKTGLISKVMRSPCNKFAIPINEPSDSKSQIQEYLDEYKGSGVQHLAFLTEDIIRTLENLKDSQLAFLSAPPNTYYEMLKDRLPSLKEDVKELKKHAVLADGDEKGYILQIFSKNIIGPIFFEIIQRENHSGFGDGNFQALFDSIERDQRERGYLS
jgi:4-hydroxyphenylpyruvate dioxygenase